MATKKQQVKRKPAKPALGAASTFVTLKLSSQLLSKYPISSIRFKPGTGIRVEDDSMRTRGAWDKNLANSQNTLNLGGDSPLKPANHRHDSDSSPSDSDTDSIPGQLTGGTNTPGPRVKLQIPARHTARRAKSRLLDTKRNASSVPAACDETATAAFEPAVNPDSNEENESPESPDTDPGAIESHKPLAQVDFEMADLPPKPQRPTLKLSFSKPSVPQANDGQAAQTPNPQSAVRTPSIKLKLGGTPLGPPTPASANGVKRKKKETDSTTPGSATKKRKLQKAAKEAGLEGGNQSQPSAKPKITFKNTSTSAPNSAQTPAPVLKLKSKGKIPKRPPGVGYDSELEDREQDPVILEGFILRMQPGPDCDFLRKQIEEGRVGVPRIKGGPEITLRMLDTLGRRGIMVIKGNRYATTLVDLPCIIEGMKSWDKKGWMKSTDICQMLLVLGRCASDDEARNYPLPPDVDPKTYQYAHGLTAPMKWVRKRRFARTKRAKVDDIEAVERRVAALLEADKAATTTRFQLHDSDPRLIEQPSDDFSDEGDDEDGEAEDDDGGYFPVVDEPDDDAVNEFQNYWESEGEGDEIEAPPTGTATHSHTGLQPPDPFDSSIAVTSNSASPLVTAAQTPASAAGHSSGDEDAEGDDDDDDDEEERDDDQKEEDEQMRRAKEVIADFKLKIKQQLEKINAPGTGPVMKRKLAVSVQNLRADIVQRKKTAGIPLDDEDEE